MKYFTKAQIEEIRKQLATMGVRDTDLPPVTEMTGEEIIAIVQDGINKQVGILKLFRDYLPEDIAQQLVNGKSAYEIAVENGFVGTEAQWLASLKGDKGDTGETGPQGLQGPAGPQGPQGPAGSGADVTWNQINTTGTKIAEIKIGDAEKIDVKAPNTGIQNVKTINNVAIAGTGNLWAKDLIRSGQDIKTINNQSIVGAGNITISGGSGEPGPQGEKGDKGDKGDTGATGPQGPAGSNGADGDDGVSIASMNYLFKAGASQSGITMPSSSDYPTIASLANIGWVTDSSTITLDSSLPYLWCFLRVEYTDNPATINHIGPWCVRYYNQELNIDYQEVATRVVGQIDSDLNEIKRRLGMIEGTGSSVVYGDGLTQILNSYIRYDDAGNGVATFRGFADAVFNAEEASIKASAGSEFTDRLAGAGLTINGIAAALQAAATKQELSGAVSDARTEWRAADDDVKAAITNTVTKAKYVWYYSVSDAVYDYNFQNKGANESFLEYEQRVQALYGTDPVTGDYNIQLRLIAEEMSAIKQESDNIMLAVGDGQNFSAGIQILKNAAWRDPNGNLITNPNGNPATGSKIVLDAQRVEVNGELSAGIITANTATIQSIASQVVTTQVIDAVDGRIRNLTVTRLNTAGEGEGASNEKITIYGNNMTVYDSDKKMRVNITADPIDLSPTAIPYPMGTGSLVSLLKTIKFTSGSGSGTLRVVIGEFSVSNNSSTISYPAIYANILAGSTNSSTATITSVWSGILTNDQSSSKVVNFTGALNSGLYSISSGETTLNSGDYLVAIDVNYTYSVNQPGQAMFTIDADPLDLDISGYTSLGSVMVVDMSENYVRIGMNGAIFNLGGGFYASFETDPDNQTPAYRRKISLMGASNGVDFGIRITGNGIEKKNLGDNDWEPL